MDEINTVYTERSYAGSSIEIHESSMEKYSHSVERVVTNGMVVEIGGEGTKAEASLGHLAPPGTPRDADIAMPPDGGYAWVIAFSGMLLNTFGFGANSAYGVFLANFLSTHRYSDARDIDFAFVGGITFGTAFLCSPLVTLALGKFHARTVILFGSTVQAGGLVLASFSTQIYQLYLTQGLMQGIGMGFLFLPANVILPQWFYKRRGIANGLMTSGAGLGGVIFSLSIQAFINSYGIPWAQRSVAIIAFVMDVVAAFLMKTRDSSIKPVVKMFDMKLLRRYEVVLLLLWANLGYYGYFVLLFSLSSYSVAMGLTHSQGAIVGACLNLAMIVGRPTVGVFMDRWGHYNVILGCSVISIILSLGMWIPAYTYGVIIGLALLVGLVSSIVNVGLTPIAAGLVDLKDLPAMFSMTWLAVGVGCIFPEPIALVIRQPQLSNPYIYCKIFTGLCYLASAICLLVIREAKVKGILITRREQKLAEIRTIRQVVTKIEPALYEQENDDTIDPIPGYFQRLVYLIKI